MGIGTRLNALSKCSNVDPPKILLTTLDHIQTDTVDQIRY